MRCGWKGYFVTQGINAFGSGGKIAEELNERGGCIAAAFSSGAVCAPKPQSRDHRQRERTRVTHTLSLSLTYTHTPIKRKKDGNRQGDANRMKGTTSL